MELIRQLVGVSAVLLLLAGALWWLRRQGLARFCGRSSQKAAMQQVERLVLSPQHALHLVRLQGRVFLVGTSPAGCALLERFDWPRPDSRSPAGSAEAL